MRVSPFSAGPTRLTAGVGRGPEGDALLTEAADYLLLESGDKILLED